MKIIEICDCDEQIVLKYKNNLALIIINDNQKPINKYGIVKIGEQSKNLILQTNSKEELKIFFDLNGFNINEKCIIRSNNIYTFGVELEAFILSNQYNT